MGRSFLMVMAILSLSIMTAYGQSDSLVLTYQEYLKNIIIFHPISKRANLNLDLAAAETLAARGNLDPVISSDWNQKNFDDKLYYQQYQAKLKFPTKLGIDFVGGYENTQGVFLNPENKTDDFGLWHLGIEVNVLQGLIINERKIAIDQARVFQELNKNEQQIVLNELVYKAASTYLTWQQYHSSQAVLTENISIANNYLEVTKESFLGGEKTAMDTLEALILYQDAIALFQKNELVLIKARQSVENYLWYNDRPVTLQEETVPEGYQSQIFQPVSEFEEAQIANHPMILAAVNKLSYFEIEQRLKREKLKPKLKIKYNPLLATGDDRLNPNYSVADYKWGFDFSMPLLLRTERANIQKGEIKIKGIEWELENKRNELQNKIESSWQQQLLLESQLNLLTGNVEGYRRLLEGENEKFNFGESSVFLLTKRQEKYIDGQLKLIKTYLKQQKERLNFLFYTNQLIEE